MKKQYEAPEAEQILFISQQKLAFSFDDLLDTGNPMQTPGDSTTISGGDILVPLP